MNATEQDTDERLSVRLRQGDLAALETLFARHSRAVYGFFYRTTGSSSTGEDLTQDVFLRVLRYSASFQPNKSFRLWLYGIARNVLSDHRARGTSDTTLDGLNHDPVSAAPSPTERLERAEARSLVHRALARLAGPERDLLLLSRFHDLRHAELAELFECTPGAIKVRVHRALKRLAVAITELRDEVPR